MVGIRAARPSEEHPVAGLRDVRSGGDVGVVVLHPLVSPVCQISVAGNVPSLPDEPVAPDVLPGIHGVDIAEQFRAVLLIHLIDAPAEELSAPLRVGIARPFAVLGVPMRPFLVSDFAARHVQQPLHIVRHMPERFKHRVLRLRAGQQQPCRQQQGQHQRQQAFHRVISPFKRKR